MHLIALSLTTMLTFGGFPASVPSGSPFVVETSVGSYPCTILASRCVVNVLNSDLRLANAACIHPAGAQTPRACFYITSLSVEQPKIPKRRVAGKH